VSIYPVYLLAPEPAPPSARLSRRSFALSVLGAFVVGGAAGFASGSGRRRAPATASGPSVEVVWAQGLRDGPVEALIADRRTYYVVFASHPDAAGELVIGFERIFDSLFELALAPGLVAEVARDLDAWIETDRGPLRERLGPVRERLRPLFR
jgi:hypothetical protein